LATSAAFDRQEEESLISAQLPELLPGTYQPVKINSCELDFIAAQTEAKQTKIPTMW
jgi:hypothetical protein